LYTAASGDATYFDSYPATVAALNQGAFGRIQSDISGTSGLSSGDPRIIQFALKLQF